jgi:predicted ATPase
MKLLEREQCFADLAAWLHDAAERGGCVALVAGEAGIGKTALVQEFYRPPARRPRCVSVEIRG